MVIPLLLWASAMGNGVWMVIPMVIPIYEVWIMYTNCIVFFNSILDEFGLLSLLMMLNSVSAIAFQEVLHYRQYFKKLFIILRSCCKDYNLELRELFYFIFLVLVNKMYLRQLRLIETSWIELIFLSGNVFLDPSIPIK